MEEEIATTRPGASAPDRDEEQNPKIIRVTPPIHNERQNRMAAAR
jgi:hypothetical protein